MRFAARAYVTIFVDLDDTAAVDREREVRYAIDDAFGGKDQACIEGHGLSLDTRLIEVGAISAVGQ